MPTSQLTEYLLFWARFVLRWRRPRIVGVTGTVGKTTTKEVIAAVLSHPEATPIVGLVWKTPGNLNDNRGLPLAVLGYRRYPSGVAVKLATALGAAVRALAFATIRPYPKLLVLEYSASDDGDVGRLAALAPLTVGIVTIVGPMHLDRFGTIERVAEEKAALVREVLPAGLVILAQDSRYSAAMDRHASAPVVKVAGRGRSLSDSIARIVGEFFGVPKGAIEEAIRLCGPVKGRLVTHEVDSITVIDDTFNASPLAMELGLDTLVAQAGTERRKVAILGGMIMLGADSDRYHLEVGAYARARADVIVGVGESSRAYEPDYWFETSEACAEGVKEIVRQGDFVYVKGAGRLRLDRVVLALTAASAVRPH